MEFLKLINKAQYGLKRLWQVVVENHHRGALEIREAVIKDVRVYWRYEGF